MKITIEWLGIEDQNPYKSGKKQLEILVSRKTWKFSFY